MNRQSHVDYSTLMAAASTGSWVVYSGSLYSAVPTVHIVHPVQWEIIRYSKHSIRYSGARLFKGLVDL
jgi:hypothetical protein